jgi:hypothetical protein
MVYHDTIPPVAVAQDITVSLDAGGNASITVFDISNGSSDNCSIQSMSLDVSTFTTSNLGGNPVTLTVTDEAGRISTSTATVTVTPYVAPTGSCHQGGTLNFPAGSWIIAMDNTLQPGKFYSTIPAGYPNAGSTPSGTTPFNLKAYGLINALLQNNIHVYWAINSVKAKNGVDIAVNAFRRFPTTAGTANYNFLSGPMVIHPSDTAAAKVIIQSFGNEVRVYQTTAPKDIEYAYKLNFKPKVLLLTNGGMKSGEWQYEKHAALFTIAGIPSSVWEASRAADVSLDGSSCYSMAAEAHWKDGEDTTNGTPYTAAAAETDRVRSFVEGGGNFLTQCAGLEPYENNERFHTSNGMVPSCGNGCAPYTDAQAALAHTEYFPANPFMQINGNLNNDPTGTYVAIRKNGGTYAPLLKQVITKNNVEKDQVAGAIKLTPADEAGGFVFYMGGHDYRKQGETDKPYDVTYVNGIRMFLNAFLTPPKRPLCASLTFCNSVTAPDTEAPQPDVLPLPTVIGQCSANVTAPTATDNVDGTVTGTTINPTNYTVQGTYSITWVFTDAAGNSSTQTQTVIIDDTTAPVPNTATLPNITAQCTATATAPTATDNCAGTVTGVSAGPTTFSGDGTYTITWRYDDGNGNVSQQNQTVIIDDTQAPVPNSVMVLVTQECSASATPPTATDNCAGTVTGTPSGPTDFTTQGTHIITWTYDDGNGNSSQQTQTVIVDDNTAPVPDVATLPNATGQCSVTATAPTATDNCAGTVTGTPSGPTTFSAQGTYSITWTYNDGNGNSSQQTQTVIVDDTTAPVPNAASLATVTGQCSATATAPTATDNCAGTVTGTPSGPTTFSTQGTFTITWTYSDGNGNSSQQTQTVIVDDTTAPVANVATLPTITGQCSASATGPAPTATDNCAGTITGAVVSFTITV